MDPAIRFVSERQIWVVDVPADRSDDGTVQYLLDNVVTQIAGAGGGEVELWIHRVTDTADALALEHGFVSFRDLWQLRCPLPAVPSSLETRAFTVDDVDALVSVNNRAFAWHPEQGGMTPDGLLHATTEPWFNADGFRLFETDGELKGFCWTKIHSDTEPVLGEIYVIAIDPSMHGRGFGAPMTLAGLDWLSRQGITDGMLYVESDNDPANATYRRIGFERHHTDRAYSLTITPDTEGV